MSFGGPPDEAHQDTRIAAAMSLARQAIEDPHKIVKGDFDRLNQLFTQEEIATLFAFVAFISGANKFGVIVGLSPDDLTE